MAELDVRGISVRREALASNSGGSLRMFEMHAVPRERVVAAVESVRERSWIAKLQPLVRGLGKLWLLRPKTESKIGKALRTLGQAFHARLPARRMRSAHP